MTTDPPPPAGAWSRTLAALALAGVLFLFIFWPDPGTPANPAPTTVAETTTTTTDATEATP